MQGFEHFYLYNNLSHDNYKEVLEPYIEKGIVELEEWPYDHEIADEFDAIQCKAYSHALKKAKKEAHWLAILDADEFFVPIKAPTISKLLQETEALDKRIGQVQCFWIVFGTSHIWEVPKDKLMIETLLLNGGTSTLYKCIVRPKFVDYCASPHHCILKPTIKMVTLGYDTVQINHYWTRDEKFLHEIKVPRREKYSTNAATVLHWASASNNETIYSKPILRFIPELRKRMGLD